MTPAESLESGVKLAVMVSPALAKAVLALSDASVLIATTGAAVSIVTALAKVLEVVLPHPPDTTTE